MEGFKLLDVIPTVMMWTELVAYGYEWFYLTRETDANN